MSCGSTLTVAHTSLHMPYGSVSPASEGPAIPVMGELVEQGLLRRPGATWAPLDGGEQSSGSKSGAQPPAQLGLQLWALVSPNFLVSKTALTGLVQSFDMRPGRETSLENIRQAPDQKTTGPVCGSPRRHICPSHLPVCAPPFPSP